MTSADQEAAATGRRRRMAGAAQWQREATAARRSAWVSANAGTGKTKVLIDRVLALLLDGASPAAILCLTFTKAAAAEMRNRLGARLRTWAVCDEQRLEDELHALTGTPPDEALRTRARGLFAAVLDTPGGLRLQTIHAFCQSVLGRFPLEAGVPPHFRLLEEQGAARRLAEVRDAVLSAAGGPGLEALGAAVSAIARHCDEDGLLELVDALLRERGRLQALLAAEGGVEGALAALSRALDLDSASQDEEAVLRAACAEGVFDRLGLRSACQALQGGGKSDQERAALLDVWLALADDAGRAAGFAAYSGAFLTGKREARKVLATKAVLAATPALADILSTEQQRLLDLEGHLRAARSYRATAALLRLGAAILDAFEAEKRRAGLLDYEDLILATRRLLAEPGRASWVLFKLDAGITHILIDEAQDTNPDQWDVVRLLAEDFFAGLGRHEDRDPERPRTLFAVGDPKQSIYGFQRARPERFVAMQRHFSAHARAAGRDWRSLTLTTSFRSTGAVLGLVDRLFADPALQQGLTFGADWPPHETVRIGQAGLVELWPLPDLPDKEDETGWTPPVERRDQLAPRLRLARLVAATIAGWLGDEAARPGRPGWLDSKGRRLRPGDLLILVRRRNAFVNAVVGALKQQGVPVAGVDRLLLGEQLAVLDLVAFGRVALLPEDDLTLAAVLKGPLVGLEEDDLFALAHGRAGSLWQSLREAAEGDTRFAAALALLDEARAQADRVSPFDFYSELLVRGGRRKLLARLGPEAEDPVEEFLAMAYVEGTDEPGSLEGFLHRLERGSSEIKRDPEAGDLVRVMTVHGAKGLQAPVVFLADTCFPVRSDDKLLWSPRDGGPDLPVWAPDAGHQSALFQAARAAQTSRQEEEERRLLYVALTRAEDRLHLCGWGGERMPADCWYRQLETAMGQAGAEPYDFDGPSVCQDGWAGAGRRLAEPQIAAPEAESPADAVEAVTAPPPEWLGRPPPREQEPPRPLSPSRPADVEPAPLSPVADGKALRFRRGLLIHRLLEALPGLDPARREAAGQRYLRSIAGDLDDAIRAALLAEVLAVLERPDFAAFFGPDARAEVPVTALLPGGQGGRVVSGQIDRLLVTEEQVLILDIKSNRPPPQHLGDVSAVYLRQLAAYAAVLQRIYPEKSVSCALLWTDGPSIMHIPADMIALHAP